MNKIRNKKGFTLIEILAVIIILGILLTIGFASYNRIIEKSKEKVFFTNVNNIVNAIKTDQILEEQDYCMYNYSNDSENQTENINSMYVIVHKEEEQIIYSVYAKMNDKNIIDIYDFSKARYENKGTWNAQNNEMSYTDFATKLFYGDYASILKNYNICALGREN